MFKNVCFVQLPVAARTTRDSIPWQPETAYIVPSAEKDATPHASEGNRLLGIPIGQRNEKL